jgi:hypothetical protein
MDHMPLPFFHQSLVTSHQSPVTSHQSPVTIHQSPFTLHQSPFTLHQSLVTSHHSPFTIHQSPVTSHLYAPLLFILVLLLPSCKGVNDITMTSVSDFEFKGMQNENILFSAVVGVHNPSNMGFRISEMNVKTTADGMYIGTLSTPDRVKVKAHSDTSYRMIFQLTLANMLTGATSLYNLSKKKEVRIELQGYIKARSWLTTHTADIKESRVVQIPAMNK